MNFSIDIWHHFDATPSASLKRIEEKLTQLTQYMASQKEEILAAVAAEKQQFLDAIQAIVVQQELPADDEQEILAAIRGIVPDTTPAPGTHNVALTASSMGQENMVVSLHNTGIDDGRLALLQGIYDSAKAAASAQPEGGEAFDSTISLTVDGTAITFTTKSAKTKAAADVAYLTAFLVQAQSQLGA
jgi:hypothetical protein